MHQSQSLKTKVGDTALEVLLHLKAGADIAFVHLHADEPTALAAARAQVDEAGGRLISITHRLERFVHFTLDGIEHSFDPNRIFTRAGIERTLKNASRYTTAAAYSARALEEVALFAQGVISLISEAGAVVAVHNNLPGEYDATFYAPGAPYAGHAERVSLPVPDRPGDFFYVNEREHFSFLTSRGFNAVLQRKELAVDDGSLSFYCARNGIPYINVETELGREAEQRSMIAAATMLLTGT